MIHIGIHTDNWRPLSASFEAACEKIAALGVKHLEFAVIHGQNFIQALGYDPGISLQANPRALKKYLDKLGLEATQIDGSYPMMGPNGSAYGVQYVQQSIRFAAEIGCPMVDTVDGAFEIPGLSFEEVFRITCDNYRQCLPWAEDYKVVINVETHGPYTSNVEFMTRLFEHFDSEYLRFNFDTGNTYISGKDPLEFCKTFRKYLTHCHIKDVSPALAAAVRGEETGIGSSEVPVGGGVNAENIKAVIKYLQQTNWDGAVSIECHGSDENTRKSLEFMRSVVGS
jgi:sugar phosphate isomerase/epimerase